jgi:hypothetical protein
MDGGNMTKPTILKKEFTVELGDDKTVTAEMNATFIYDANYGADADGNRGMGVWFVDDVYPTHEIAYDDDGRRLTREEIELAQDLLEILASEESSEELT